MINTTTVPSDATFAQPNFEQTPASSAQSNVPSEAEPSGMQSREQSQPVITPQRPQYGQTLFQQFVQENTGQLLPIYGSQFFSTPQLYAPVLNTQPPDNYILGPGDEIQLDLTGAANLRYTFRIDPDGRVTIPTVGPITLAGVRAADLERVLRQHMAKVYTNFQLAAKIARLRAIQVYLVGHAAAPGTYTLSNLSTVINALFASGGPAPTGTMRAIEVRRQGKRIGRIDLYDFITRGDTSKDITLQPGDVITIPPVGPQVALTGAVDSAAIYELPHTGGTLGEVIELAGGLPALASPQKAIIERIDAKDPQAPRRVIEVALDANGLKTPLKDGDIIRLIALQPAFGETVTLQGHVANPLRYAWFPGMRILDLIPDAQALIKPDYYRQLNQRVMTLKPAGDPLNQIRVEHLSINWDYAVIERLDRQTLRKRLIPFNLGKAVLQRDPAHNLPLEPGDVVTVFDHKDMTLPLRRRSRFVLVEGEVAAPGLYEVAPDETLPQLLARIGGVTPQAYLYGLAITRESVRQQQQANLDKLITQLERSLLDQSGETLSNVAGITSEQVKILLDQQRNTAKRQLDLLRQQKSSGRFALHLKPEIDLPLDALPSITLEDGDRIVVPPRPSFVAVFGAVRNENALVWREGITVGDALRLAGVSDDAETAEIFVLRADGTVVANRDRSSWFAGIQGEPLMPGDSVVVPFKADRETKWSFFMRNLKDITQIFSNLGLGLAALNSL